MNVTVQRRETSREDGRDAPPCIPRRGFPRRRKTRYTLPMSTDLLREIADLSRDYGGRPNWVIGGGGNTSIKDRQSLWIKASGTTLAEITQEQFVRMDRARLAEIWSKTYPDDADTREERALADLMATRGSEETEKRPSVETLMHALFPHRIVFHTHPTMLNGLTCSREGENAARRVLGAGVLWIPTVNPGYILARTIFDLVEQWRNENDGAYPQILIMQNHGLVVAGETPEEIHDLHASVTDALEATVTIRPDDTPAETDPSRLEEIRDAVAHAVADHRAALGDALNPPDTRTFTSPELLRRAATKESFAAMLGALTPDHIVYSGHKPCYVPDVPRVSLAAEIRAAIIEYCQQEEVCPRIVVVGGHGAVALGATPKKTRLAQELFLDALQVVRYAENFGGVSPMPEDQVEFIRNWEVEKFREEVSTA